MAKKKSIKGFLKFVPFCLIAIAAIIIGMGFIQAIGGDTYINMYTCAFGGNLANFGKWGSIDVSFCFWLVMALFLPLIGAVVSLFVKGKIGGIVSTVCFLYTGIFAWFTPMVAGGKISTFIGNSNWASFADSGLAAGSILVAIFGIIGTLVSAYYTYEA